jgi:hypothetical protein
MLVEGELNAATIGPILQANIAKEARLMTDDAHVYKALGKNFSGHNVVNHTQKEYVSKENPTLHTNTIEGFFGIFKRGVRGVYQHVSKQHLHRYLAEFDYRYTNRVALGIDDEKRAELAVKGAVGRRLMYRPPNRNAEA